MSLRPASRFGLVVLSLVWASCNTSSTALKPISAAEEGPEPALKLKAVVDGVVAVMEQCMDRELDAIDEPSGADFDRVEAKCERAGSAAYVAAGGDASAVMGYQRALSKCVDKAVTALGDAQIDAAEAECGAVLRQRRMRRRSGGARAAGWRLQRRWLDCTSSGYATVFCVCFHRLYLHSIRLLLAPSVVQPVQLVHSLCDRAACHDGARTPGMID